MSGRSADKYLQQVIQLSEQMIELAYAGDANREDVGCGIVFGSLRDNAYKVRKLAEDELRRHAEKTDPTQATRKDSSQSEGTKNHEREEKDSDR